MNTTSGTIPQEQTLFGSLRLWLAWVLVSTAALFAGLFIFMGGGNQLGGLLEPAPLIFLLLAITVEMMGGLAVALVQFIVMRRFARARTWIGWTVLGWIPVPLAIWEGALGAAVAGAILGVCQWRALGKTLPRAAWWIPASSLGWLLGSLIRWFFSTLPVAHQELLGPAAAVLAASMVTGVALAAIAAPAGRRRVSAGITAAATVVIGLAVTVPFQLSVMPQHGVVRTEDYIAPIAFSADGSQLAGVEIGDDGDWLIVWDTHDWSTVKHIALHGDYYFGEMSLFPDGTAMLVSFGNVGRLLDLSTAQEKWVHEETRAFALSPDGKTLALAYGSFEEPWLELVDTGTGAVRKKIAQDLGSGVYALTFSPDGQSLVTLSDLGTVSLWDADTLEMRRRVTVEHPLVDMLKLRPDGKVLVAAGGDLRMTDMQTGANLTTVHLNETKGRIAWNVMDLSPDGKLLAVVYSERKDFLENKEILLYDLASGTLLHTFTGHVDSISSVLFSPDGQYLVSAAEDKTIRVWDVTDLAR